MKTIDSGLEGRHTEIVCVDAPDESGACHCYEIHGSGICKELATIRFQKGPVKEVGVNGIQCEDLLAVVIDRLRGFQAGPFSCNANEWALQHCVEALKALNKRTLERQMRGVEGKNIA